jgi:hypothetical protein
MPENPYQPPKEVGEPGRPVDRLRVFALATIAVLAVLVLGWWFVMIPLLRSGF